MASQCPPGIDCTADLGPSVAPIVSPILILAVLAVVARLYCRHLTGHHGTPSDYTIIAGLIVSAALTAMVLYSRPPFYLHRQRQEREADYRLQARGWGWVDMWK